MPWVKKGDGLAYEGNPHWDVDELERALAELEKTRTNNPGRVCSELRTAIARKFVDKDVVFRLSKWCHWSNEDAERNARHLGNLLFGKYAQPRFREQDDRSIRDADRLYDEWRTEVVSLAVAPEPEADTGKSGGGGVDSTDKVTGLLRQFRQVILYGPPGTGKTLHAQRAALALLAGEPAATASTTPADPPTLANSSPGVTPTGGLTPHDVERIERLQQEGRLGFVVFHPAYEYEQFVIGISPNAAPDGAHGLSYRVEPGVLWLMCKEAESRPAVLIIDEINRGNLPKLLGELVYALEYRDRTVRLPVEYKGTRDFKVPKNLYIIGTMNSSDRSIGHIDVAVRRRFGLLHVEPQPAVVRAFWEVRDREFGSRLVELMTRLNGDLGKKDAGGELQVGHAYFLADPDCTDAGERRRQVARKWEHQVYQLLQEYDQLLSLGSEFFKRFPPTLDRALQWK